MSPQIYIPIIVVLIAGSFGLWQARRNVTGNARAKRVETMRTVLSEVIVTYSAVLSSSNTAHSFVNKVVELKAKGTDPKILSEIAKEGIPFVKKYGESVDNFKMKANLLLSNLHSSSKNEMKIRDVVTELLTIIEKHYRRKNDQDDMANGERLINELRILGDEMINKEWKKL